MDGPDPLGIGFMPNSYGTIDPQLGFPYDMPYDDHDPTYSDYIMPSSFDDMSHQHLSKPQPGFLHPGFLDNGQVFFDDGDCHDADVIRVSPPPPASKPSRKEQQPTPPQTETAGTTSKGASTRRATASAKRAPKRPSPDSPDSSSEKPQAPRKSERRTRATARQRDSFSATTTTTSTKHAAHSAAAAKAASDSPDDESQAGSPSPGPAPSGSKRDQSLRRNRIAASKCRQKKKEWQSNLEVRKGELESKNAALVREYTELLAEATAIKNTLMSHASCQDANIDTWLAVLSAGPPRKGCTTHPRLMTTVAIAPQSSHP
jgi:hypothetical protein